MRTNAVPQLTKKHIKTVDMKRFFLAIAALVLSAGLMSAQDLKTATDTYNSGAEQLTMGNKTAALEKFQAAFDIAKTLEGDGVEDLVNNCKNAIASTTLSIAKEMYNNKNFDEAITKMKEAEAKAKEFGNEEIAKEAASLIPQVEITKDMEAANAAFKAKDVAGAIAGYTKVMAADTANGVAALRLGQLLSGTGKFSEAIQYLGVAARNGQEGNAKSLLSSTYLKDAVNSLKNKNYTGAVASAVKANEFKENAQAYLIAGQASQKAGKNADAISYFEKYLEAAPTAKNAGAIAYTVGALYQQAGNKAKAIENYKKVLSDPQFGAEAKKLIDSLSK